MVFCWCGVGWGMYSRSCELAHEWSRCYAVAVGWGMYSWVGVGVGWGGYVMLRYCTFSWTSAHTSCRATGRSLGLPCVRHATLLDVVLDFHTYVMLRCYAAVRSLGLPCVRHATPLDVVLDFHTHVMLRYCAFSWTSTHRSRYATVRSLGLPHIRHATLLYVSLGFPHIRHATLRY